MSWEKKKFTTESFDRGAKIRDGELDDEMPGYEELTGWLQRVPRTWMPGLLRQAIVSCKVDNVFAGDDAMRDFVSRTIQVANDPNSMLRKAAQ